MNPRFRNAALPATLLLAAAWMLATTWANPRPQETRSAPSATSKAPELPGLRIGMLGCPLEADVEWSEASLTELKGLGFNTIQLNVAWGTRPNDEPLNLEDVVELPGEVDASLRQSVPLKSDPSAARIAKRRGDLKHRIELCRELGLRTIFHFGAPYNGSNQIDNPPNCLLDGKTPQRYVALLKAFNQQFPGVDDLLIYTFDQDAWLCSEFGPCEACLGKPLHQRASAFINLLGDTWRQLSPQGRVWWEPWELSSGQVLMAIPLLHPDRTGLTLHCNIAEVMATLCVDRWLENSTQLAADYNLPVIVEYWLGGPSEELEPFRRLSHPLVTLRGLKKIAALPDLAGVKEYYGLLPRLHDANLAMTAVFFKDRHISEEEAMAKVAEPYGDAAQQIVTFWKHTSRAMELFPWETTWLMRRIGTSDPVHSLSAAYIRGVPWHSPSWMSTRRSIFMKTDDSEPDPWMLEDVQLRCALSAAELQKAHELGLSMRDRVPAALRPSFEGNLDDLQQMTRRVLAYSYHCRETNLAHVMREFRRGGRAIPDGVVREMAETLRLDQVNQGPGNAIDEAIEDLQQDADKFLEKYFIIVPDGKSKGYHTVTSR